MSSKKQIGLCCMNGAGETILFQSSTDAVGDPMAADFSLGGRKDHKTEPMPEEGAMRLASLTEKEATSFRPTTEKQGATGWLGMRRFSTGGSTGARTLGEALTNL